MVDDVFRIHTCAGSFTVNSKRDLLSTLVKACSDLCNPLKHEVEQLQWIPLCEEDIDDIMQEIKNPL